MKQFDSRRGEGWGVIFIIVIIIVLITLTSYTDHQRYAEQRVKAVLKDVNNDGLQDLVIKYELGYENVLFGQSDGTFRNLEEILDELPRNEHEKAKQKYSLEPHAHP